MSPTDPITLELFKFENELNRLGNYRNDLIQKIDYAIGQKIIAQEAIKTAEAHRDRYRNEVPVIHLASYAALLGDLTYARTRVMAAEFEIEKTENELKVVAESIVSVENGIERLSAELEKRSRLILFRRPA